MLRHILSPTHACNQLIICFIHLCCSSSWLNKQRSLACAAPQTNFRELRKMLEEKNKASNGLGTKKKKKRKSVPVLAKTKTEEELLAGIDFSCLDSPRTRPSKTNTTLPHIP
jgi:hypothetical protein